ncbi:MAG: T9SS type A sorting domain-containing protein [Phaeodactylibacter sp.]|nr:T9SS type A sorting domain-containing protein [Phaeodactylibacter sp.]MCB9051727.1 T9SS type A sorting domain-containing protein [Lewinellaceae bacterium]
MKNYLATLFLSFSLCAHAQEGPTDPPSFVSEANRWHLFVGVTEPPNFPNSGHLVWYTKIYRFRDTIQRNGQVYQKLWVTTDNPDLQSWAYTQLAFRQETGGKAYRYREGEQGEELMYDFSLGEGDEITYSNGLVLQVTAVDSVELSDGSRRKRMAVSTPWTPPTIPAYQPPAWIEGIGSIRNTFKPEETFITNELAELLCFFKEEERLYSDVIFQACYLIVYDAEEEPTPAGWRVFPNPAGNAITLEFLWPFPQDVTLRIFSLAGQTIAEHRLPAHTERVNWDISGLEPGMYLLEARAEGKMRSVKKFIKK